MIYCFRCFKMKPIYEFQDNRRHYQIKSRQGKVFSCNTCAKDWTVNNLMAVRYNFAENNWNIHRFSCGEEALKFLEDEHNTRLRLEQNGGPNRSSCND